MVVVDFWYGIPLDGEFGYMHLRKCIYWNEYCQNYAIKQRKQLHQTSIIMKSFTVLILDQILGFSFKEKKPQMYCAYMAWVANLFQYFLACNFKLCNFNTTQFISLTFSFSIYAGLYLRHFWLLHF